nr:MAG TPA: hypothetical protein [Caudoviricetes sp.]
MNHSWHIPCHSLFSANLCGNILDVISAGL